MYILTYLHISIYIPRFPSQSLLTSTIILDDVYFHYFVCVAILYFVVTITKPPEDTTVCRGSNVTISCGYQWSRALPVTWLINETLLTQQDIVDNPLYQLNNPTTPMEISITVISINGTTAFQCRVYSTPDSTSTLGTVTVIGIYICMYVCIIYLP